MVKIPGEGKHSEKWHRCVDEVRARGGVESPEAVCTASLGEESYGSIEPVLTKSNLAAIDKEIKKMNNLAKFEYSFDIKTIKPQERIIQGIASLEQVDRDNELVSLEAIDKGLNAWKKNPIVRYKHTEPIGKGIPEESHIDFAKHAFIVTAYISDKTEKSREAWGLIEDGILKSFSIGGKVLKRATEKDVNGKEVNKITDIDLYEVSVVDIPSNQSSFFDVIGKAVKELDYSLSKEDEELGEDESNEESTSIKIKEKVGKMSEETNKQNNGETEEEKKKREEEEKKKKEEEQAAQGKTSTENIVKIVQTKVEEEMKKFISSQPVRKAMLDGQDSTNKTEFKMAEIYTAKEYGHETYYTKGIEGGSQTLVTEDLREPFKFKEAYENLQKYTYTQTGGVGTAGYALIPVYVDPDIIDRTRREIPFIEMVPRRAVQGLTYDYNAITTLTNAVALNEDAALNDLTDVYDRISVTMRFLYSTGRVTGQMIAASRGYADALAREVQNRTIGMKRFEDYLALGAQSAPNFSGIQGQVTTNTTALSGPLTISAIRTELAQCRDAGGVPNIIVTTNTLSNSLKGLLMDYQRYVDTTKIAWGIETMSFDGIPVIVDRYVSAGYFWILDMSVIFMAVLQDMVYEELAKTNDSNKFTLKMYEALVIRAEAFCSGLSGCT